MSDNLTLQIIASMVRDPYMTISKIAKEVGTSRSTVRKRLRELSEENLIQLNVGLNHKIAQLTYGIMLFTLANAMELSVLFERLENCPRVLAVVTHVGPYHAVAVLMAEDGDNLLFTTECLQARITFKEVNFLKVASGSILFPQYLALRKLSELDRSPCGQDCLDCIRYIKKQCYGCPGSSRYRKSTSILNIGKYYNNSIVNSEKD